MSNLYRGPSIDASYHVSFHLAKWLPVQYIWPSGYQSQSICYTTLIKQFNK
jgi:hypothetical protein